MNPKKMTEIIPTKTFKLVLYRELKNEQGKVYKEKPIEAVYRSFYDLLLPTKEFIDSPQFQYDIILKMAKQIAELLVEDLKD